MMKVDSGLGRHKRPYGGDSDDEKLEFSKDYDHILYSSAFRRLSGVTQVVGVNETALFHNRLTHSLKVAQVGRRLTSKLQAKIEGVAALETAVQQFGGGLDSRVVNAACIAHDLGHPPFGHIAEMAFQKILSGKADTDETSGSSVFPRVGEGFGLPDSFEGNAQSFRIVNKLAFRESYSGGKSAALNLTKATLAALLKYPWGNKGRPPGIDPDYKKWGYYDSEKGIFDLVEEGLIVGRDVSDNAGGVRREYRTIEAQVMDWADDISYAIHDVEDFFRAGLIPLDILGESDKQFGNFFEYAWKRVAKNFVSPTATDVAKRAAKARVENLLDSARGLLPAAPYAGTRNDRETLHTFASTVIRRATDNVELTDTGLVQPAERELAIIEVFKQLTWFYVIDRPSLTSAQKGQIYLMRQLFRDLLAWVKEEFPKREENSLPPRLWEYVSLALDSDSAVGSVTYESDEHKIRRAVVDYICSLTEGQAVQLSSRLHGATSASILESWFHM